MGTLRRFGSFSLLLLLVLSLAACGGGEAPPGTEPPAQTEEPPAQTEEVRAAFPAGYNLNVLYPAFTQAVVTSEKVYLEPNTEAKHVNFRPLENEYCLVLAECVATEPEDWSVGAGGYESGERWLLVSYTTDGLPLSDMGWVPYDSCVEYTEETRALINSPLRPAPGAQSRTENGEATGALADNAVLNVPDLTPNEHGVVPYTGIGGLSGWIRPEDVVYPAVGESYFDGWQTGG